MQKLRKLYSNEVQFGYRHFPLPFHKEAKVLAQAVECARDQNKFWELQHLFYKNISGAANEKEIMELVKLAGIEDTRVFQTCWRKGKYEQRIQNDIREGVELIRSGRWTGWTPTALLGTKLAGKGLPESMREVAQARTSEIGNAYERIRAARG